MRVSFEERPSARLFPACGDSTGNCQCYNHGPTCSHPVPQCVATDCIAATVFPSMWRWRSSIFWNVPQRQWVLCCKRFGASSCLNGQYVLRERNFFVDILTLDSDADTVSPNVGNEQAWRSWPLTMTPIRCSETSAMNKYGDLDPWRWKLYGVPKRRYQATHWRCRTSHYFEVSTTSRRKAKTSHSWWLPSWSRDLYCFYTRPCFTTLLTVVRCFEPKLWDVILSFTWRIAKWPNFFLPFFD